MADDANIDTIIIDEKYESIIDKTPITFLEWQNHRGTSLEAVYRNKYKHLRKLAKAKIEHRQEEYWGEVCEGIEKSTKSNDPATVFSIIRRLKGGIKRLENIPIEDKNVKLLVSSTDQLEHWREYFCELLNAYSTVDPCVINEVQITIASRLDLERQNAQPSFEEVTADILKAGGEPVIK
ncbi:unnamed protein product [Rotaria socialis]